MKVNFLYTLLLIAIASCLFSSCFVSDSSSPEPEDVFVKIYGGVGNETVVGVDVPASADTYFLAGNSTSNPLNSSGLEDIYLIRTTTAGDLLNEVFISLNDGDSTRELANSFKVFEDRIGVVGQVEARNDLGAFSSKEVFYAILDFDLNVLSLNSISNQEAFGQGGVDIVGNDIVQTQDGNFVILATIGEDTDLNRDVAYMKVDANGNMIWARRNVLPGDDAGVSIIEFPSGDLGICGETSRTSQRGFRGQNVLFLVTSDLGLLRSSLAFGSIQGGNDLLDDIPAKMINDGAGALLVGNSGLTNSPNLTPFVLSLSAGGVANDLTTMTVDPSILETYSSIGLTDMKRSLNGELIFTGGAVREGFAIQVIFGRSDQNGEILMTVNDIGDNNADVGRGIFQLPDGDVLIAATVGFGNTNNKIGLFKVNGNGQLLE